MSRVGDGRRRVLLGRLRRRDRPLTTSEVAMFEPYASYQRGRSFALTDLLALSAEGLVRIVAVPPRPVCWVARPA